MKKIIYGFMFIGIIACEEKNATPKLVDQSETEVKSISIHDSITTEDNGSQEDGESQTKILKFTGYGEGDSPHLLFEENNTGKKIDLSHINDKKYGEIVLLLDDNKSSMFGFKANPEYIGKTFSVNLKKEEIGILDESTMEVVQIKIWIIKDMKLYKNSNDQ